MVDPLSIKCPHCSAGIKIKSKSAFGEKVKCPKCETSFVIPKPISIKSASTRKKPQPSTLADHFVDEEPDSSSELFEDDFDDWEDDLESGATVQPKPKKKHVEPTQSEYTEKPGFSLSDYGFSPFITGIFLFLILLNLVLFFVSPKLLIYSFSLSILVGVSFLLAGGVGLLIEAAKESGTELILCLLVPFYNLYFGISRFESTKNAIAAYVVSVMLMMAVLFLFALSGDAFPDKNQDIAHNSPPPNMARTINDSPSISSIPFGKPRNQSDNSPTDLIQSHRPSNTTVPRAVGSSLSPISKFDLSGVKPMLMSWPAEGMSGHNVYSERDTFSSANVFEASNFEGFSSQSPAGGNMKFRVYLPPRIDLASPVPCVLVPPAGSNLLSGMDIDSRDLIPNPEHEPYIKAGFAVVSFSIDGHLVNGERVQAIFNFYQPIMRSKRARQDWLTACTPFWKRRPSFRESTRTMFSSQAIALPALCPCCLPNIIRKSKAVWRMLLRSTWNIISSHISHNSSRFFQVWNTSSKKVRQIHTSVI
tara:strand:+ start:143075 stop:144673 length:1599 start_codon:yes stop_codon:yes gene_type:complete